MFTRRKPLVEHITPTLPGTWLQYTQGSSDKVYHLEIKADGAGYTVHFEYGRRNASLTRGTKAERVSITEATSVFMKIRSEKMRKGYKEFSLSTL